MSYEPSGVYTFEAVRMWPHPRHNHAMKLALGRKVPSIAGALCGVHIGAIQHQIGTEWQITSEAVTCLACRLHLRDITANWSDPRSARAMVLLNRSDKR